MSNHKIRRSLWRALTANLFSNYGFDHARESYQGDLSRPTVPYRCPRCRGVKRAKRARMCRGYEGHRHVDEPTKMVTIDSDTAPADTPGLDVR